MVNKIIMVDIDGPLVDYPKCFLDWVENNKDLHFDDLDNMKEQLSRREYEDIKEQYRFSGIKRKLPIINDAKETLMFFKQKGWKIWIVTRRPNISPVNVDTKYWLDYNAIPFDQLIFSQDKTQLFNGGNNICIVVDDDIFLLKWVSENTKAMGFVGDWEFIRKTLDLKEI